MARQKQVTTEKEIEELKKQIQADEKKIAQLTNECRVLQHDVAQAWQKVMEIRESRAYKIALCLQKARHLVLPDGSARLKLLKKTARFFIGGKKSKNAFPLPDLFPLNLSRTKIEEYPKLEFADCEKPLVSIVIPVFNQFEYTYNCLLSVLKKSGDVQYEVIVADDSSTDLTRQIEEVVSGLRVVRTKGNLRFLLNCNNAAKAARGKYILFLNNDTQVQDDWLSPLVRLLEETPAIGMTGSKLIYPDGSLQEAGGIIWNDASAWNFGHGKDPSLSEFNYVKDVDYISGASIMIRASLWKKLKGFDPFFAPAYYEDTDLAFRVRQAGYRVVFQPLSVVVHFEGRSNGTDVTSGQKKFQEVNKKKFFERWEKTLSKENYLNGTHVFKARERSGAKPCILVIDQGVPTFDQDAGSRTTFQYIKMFLSHGFNVKFLDDKFFYSKVYTTVLQQMGVEVLYGRGYMTGWADWILQNKDEIDFCYLNRPGVSAKYIDFIKEKTNIKCIYYGHDLHSLRVRRGAALSKSRAKEKEADEWQKIEFGVMKKCDVSYFPSSVEVQVVRKTDPSINVKAVNALYVYDNVDLKTSFAPNKRSGILFVGGFSHAPNVDGIKWFLSQAFPKIYERQKINFSIIGSHAPEDLKRLQREGVSFEGSVSEEQLDDFYKTAKIVVVPLTYGAGIKGKVIEAMKYGVPVVTTSIGAEGILGAEKILCVKDDAEAFADAVVSLYNDESRLKEMSVAERKFVSDNYSSCAIWKIMGPDFTSRPPKRP